MVQLQEAAAAKAVALMVAEALPSPNPLKVRALTSVLPLTLRSRLKPRALVMMVQTLAVTTIPLLFSRHDLLRRTEHRTWMASPRR
jgi:hypothetical protein